MLQGEQAPPEAILTLDGNVVNRLFEFLKHDADRELGRRFLCHLKEVQVFSYETLRAQLCCPSCNSPHFVRKGWRRRVVKSTRGRLEAVVLQARCKLCGRTFRPLNTRIGLSTGRRFLDEMLESALKLSLQLSYGRSSAIMRKLTGGQICGETLHVSQIRTGEALHLREGAWEVASQTIDHLRPPALTVLAGQNIAANLPIKRHQFTVDHQSRPLLSSMDAILQFRQPSNVVRRQWND